MPIYKRCVLVLLLPACEAIATLAYYLQCRFISRHSVFGRHLSYTTEQLTSALSRGTALNVSAYPTFPLFTPLFADRTLVLLDCLFLTNTEQILLRLGREQLVVIKTEREAKEENWVTDVSKEKNCWDVVRPK